MKETGIPMSGDHPKLILEGGKTQTRRVIVPQPNANVCQWKKGINEYCFFKGDGGLEYPLVTLKCPYGQVGDRLWVRETYVIENDMEYGYSGNELKQWAKDRPIKTEDGGFDWGIYHLIPHYRATEEEPNIVPDYVDDFDDKTRWSSSRFMPRWASRITLEITEVKVERLKEISEEDAQAEGITDADCRVNLSEYDEIKGWGDISYTEPFARLWDSLNAKRGYGWETNCWVWVISFEVVR